MKEDDMKQSPEGWVYQGAILPERKRHINDLEDGIHKRRKKEMVMQSASSGPLFRQFRGPNELFDSQMSREEVPAPDADSELERLLQALKIRWRQSGTRKQLREGPALSTVPPTEAPTSGRPESSNGCGPGRPQGRVKFLMFHTDDLPAYYGKLVQQCQPINGRRPFSRQSDCWSPDVRSEVRLG
eukprot:CAMPEP_0196659552 /NCGR_PEP_ID=MMETSP1086-20130531/35585_1 /TAXON_ID=77921 /ORGANISM="Cyanoptyche  gloeocystis , Strain SAG4.97" /LENGTH=184 /DNA_ID=CAMNT_0041993585 /DNA_START=177 /DNA_END=727 /DNA_ORIENTATION=+